MFSLWKVSLVRAVGVVRPLCLYSLASVALLSMTSFVAAQEDDKQAQQDQQQEMTSREIALPPQDQVLSLRVKAPEQARASQTFEYEIIVENTSNNVAVRNVKLKQTAAKKFSVESATRKKSTPESGSQADQQDDASENEQTSSDESQSDEQANEDQKQSGQQQKSGSQTTWVIKELMPGQSETIRVKASSDQEGEGKACISIVHFEPSICVPIRFVKPELDLVKKAPEKANLCEPFRIIYTVKNTGSGDPGAFEIRDTLGEGLMTETGEQKLSFTVDGLPGGETRRFAATVMAKKQGTFKSRAVAVVSKDNKTRSKQSTTKVIGPDVAVKIEGPSKVYIDQPFQYTVYVANNGNAPATGAELKLHYPSILSVADSGSPRKSDKKAGEIGGQSGSNQQPTAAAQIDGQSQSDQSSSQQVSLESDQFNAESVDWDLGALKPGEVRKVNVTFRTDRDGKLPMKAVAVFDCSTADELDNFQAQATALAQARVVALPALMVAMIDEEDSVPVGDEVVYVISVKNQGQAPDKDIEVTVNLPQQLEYVDASGPTKATADGQTVTFEPVKTLGAGEAANWELRVKAKKEGQVRTKLELKSQMLEQAVQTAEPTRVLPQTGG